MASSSVMYAIHKQLHPPTGVEHAIYCHFFNRHEKNLVMAGTNQLRVFRLTPDTDNTGRIRETSDSKSPKMKMECLQTYSLFGNIMSLRSVQLAGSPRDALLLSFRHAKLSVVEYDPGTDDLKTLSLHYFEEDEMKDGRLQISQIPEIRVDPEGRCAVMMAYGNKIVVLPFRKETVSDDGDTLYGSSGKSPVLASYTIHIKELEEKMDNIIDLQFLHGYYEPTLLFLYEPLKTWAGRIAVRQDTCAIAAISLNIQQRVHPVIWSVGNLPFDCLRALVVPRPIGGVMVLCVNAVLYLNQSVPPYGVSLNSIADHSTAFPLKVQDNVKLGLDCSQATFIANDKLVLSLKGGELYVLTLFVDSMRSVRSFHFDKAAASILTTCVCVCDDGYLFLGSRLGNSLLLRYLEKNIDFNEITLKEIEAKKDDKNLTAGEEPAQKKKKLEHLGDWMASNVASIEDPDELEVYGSETHTATRATSYSFEVCDSLLNIGPCGQMSPGEPAFLSEEFANSIDPDVEIVLTSGYSKNGALTVLQRSVRPQVVTTFELPGVVDMWTVVGLPHSSSLAENADDKSDTETTEEPSLDNSHSFLILSRSDSSMILQTGQEINELDHSGFSTQAPTVFAGNIGNNKYIVQVSPMGVRLLEGVKQIQHIPLDVGSPIVQASVGDPYLFIMSEEGQIILLTLRQDDYSTRLTVTKPPISHQKQKIHTMCVYCDASGLFTTRSVDASTKDQDGRNNEVISSSTTSEEKDAKSDPNSMDFDDEEELLYGNCSANAFANTTDQQPTNKSDQTNNNTSTFTEVTPTYWLVIVRDNGILEIYSVDDFKLVYLVKNFPMGFKVLVDSVQATVSGAIDKQSEKHNDTLPVVKEILLVGLGHCKKRPILLARVDEDLFIYEAFPFYETQTENHLKLRFRKVAHPMIIRERKWYKSRRKQDQQEKPQSCRLSYLRYFEDIASYSGVFICGYYPHWLFLTSRGELRVHPMGIDGSVTCFSPFHNVNCPKGFLYFNRQGELRICVLPTHLSYDAPWPVRKVPLRCTSHFVSYHVESKTYCVVTSTSEPCNRLVKLTGEDKEYEVVERDDRFIYPTIEKFSVQLFSPVSWEAIPNTKFDLEEWEHVTCLQNVSLVYEGARSGLKGYMAIGTNYNYGEDVTSRGRILILDVIEVVPEPGQPLTKNRIKIIYSKEQKGPVSALCQVAGYLLSCIGQKIYVWQLKDEDLVGIAFIDTQVYIHTAVSIKNLILIADIYKSISLLRFQEDVRTLSLVSRDVKTMEVYAIDFFIDNNQIAFLVSDAEKNLLLFMYHPEARESCGGQRLLRRGDFYIGSNINSFFRVRGKLADPSTDKTASSALEKKHITIYSTLDGSLGYLLPISEKVYRRLLMLQNVLVTHLPHTAGLNPKAYRMYKSHRNHLMNPHKNMLDGDLLWKYLNLSFAEKTEISKKIGTTADQIVEDLMDVDRTTAHF